MVAVMWIGIILGVLAVLYGLDRAASALTRLHRQSVWRKAHALKRQFRACSASQARAAFQCCRMERRIQADQILVK